MSDPSSADAAAIRECAIRLLARREHSRLELHRKLEGRGFPAAGIPPVLDALMAEDLLSDQRFAEMFARTRSDNGQGPLKIRAELQARGVDGTVIDQGLELVDDTWLDYCRAAWRRRFGTPPADCRERARQTRFLAARGFDAGTIRRVLDEDDDEP